MARVHVLGAALACFMTVAALAASPAQAQCTKDTDCKGNRVCQQGACVDPSPSAPAPPPASVAPTPPPPVYQTPPPGVYQAPPRGYLPPPYYPMAPMAPMGAAATRRETSAGWAAGAGTYGIISAAIVFGLAVASEATKSKTVPSAPLGGTATLLFAVSLPVVAVGGGSARENPMVTGSPSLRISGWIGYAVALGDAAILLSKAGTEEPADGQILSVGMLGAAAMACFIADAFMSASEATRIAQFEKGTGSAGVSRRGIWAPFVARDPANPHRLATGLAWGTPF